IKMPRYPLERMLGRFVPVRRREFTRPKQVRRCIRIPHADVYQRYPEAARFTNPFQWFPRVMARVVAWIRAPGALTRPGPRNRHRAPVGVSLEGDAVIDV